MKYYKIDIELLDAIETELDIKFKLTDAAMFSLINSYNSLGQNCTMSQKTIGEYLKCSYKTVSRTSEKLITNKIITVFKPKNQMQEQLALTYHIHKDIKKLIKKIVDEKTGTKCPQAVDKMSDKVSTYTNNSSVSEETSLIDVPSSTETKKKKEVEYKTKPSWELALEKIN